MESLYSLYPYVWVCGMQAFVQFITMQFQLCSVFFTFSLGTRTHYFGRTILHGGAKVEFWSGAHQLMCFSIFSYWYNICLIKSQYRATGRGFVVRHIKFAENYRLYSRSHFVKGFVITWHNPQVACANALLLYFLQWLFFCFVGWKLHFCWWFF